MQEVCNEKQTLNLKRLSRGWETKCAFFPLSIKVCAMVERFHRHASMKAVIFEVMYVIKKRQNEQQNTNPKTSSGLKLPPLRPASRWPLVVKRGKNTRPQTPRQAGGAGPEAPAKDAPWRHSAPLQVTPVNWEILWLSTAWGRNLLN